MTTKKTQVSRPVDGLVGLLHKRIDRLETEKTEARTANPPKNDVFTEAFFRQAEARMWLATVLEMKANTSGEAQLARRAKEGK